MVLDIETRTDACALRETRRKGAPRGMPTGLQYVIAAATLEFSIDEDGSCGDFSLSSLDRAGAGEPAVVSAVEGRLAALADADGVLVTFNGGHDLGIIRLASARHRRFDHAAAKRWLRADGLRHEDLMLEYESGAQAWPRLDDLAASFGLTSNREVVVGAAGPSPERMKCELDVILTMALYLHLLSERERSGTPLLHGARGLAAMMASRAAKGPHLLAALRAPVFAALARAAA